MKRILLVLLVVIASLLLCSCQSDMSIAPVDQTSSTGSQSPPELQKPAWPAPTITAVGNGYMTVTYGKGGGGAAYYRLGYTRYLLATETVDFTSGFSTLDRTKDITLDDQNILTGYSYRATVVAYNNKDVELGSATSALVANP